MNLLTRVSLMDRQFLKTLGSFLAGKRKLIVNVPGTVKASLSGPREDSESPG